MRPTVNVFLAAIATEYVPADGVSFLHCFLFHAWNKMAETYLFCLCSFLGLVFSPSRFNRASHGSFVVGLDSSLDKRGGFVTLRRLCAVMALRIYNDHMS